MQHIILLGDKFVEVLRNDEGVISGVVIDVKFASVVRP